MVNLSNTEGVGNRRGYGEKNMNKYVLWSYPWQEKNIRQKLEVFYPDVVIEGLYSGRQNGSDGCMTREELESLYRGGDVDGVIVSSTLAGRFPGTTISDMLDELSLIGIKKVFIIPATLLLMPLEEIRDGGMGKDFLLRPEDFSEPLVIKFLASEGCNLNCAGCTHFSPLIQNPHLLTPEELMRDLTQLKKVFRYIRSIEFLGGEPLLNENISELTNIARSMFPYSYIAILTNGTLIPRMTAEQLQAVQRNNVKMVISRYKPTDAIADDIEYTLEKWNIPYDITEKIEYFRLQYNTEGNRGAKENYEKCPDHLCHTIRNGKLGGCYYATMAKYANEGFGMNIPYEDSLYDIYEPKWTGPELFWRMNRPTRLCAYCNSVVSSPVMPWHVTRRGSEDEGDWFYNDPVKPDETDITTSAGVRTLHCAFYGGGGLCRWIIRAWVQDGVRPKCVIDRNASEKFSDINGIPVILPSRISEFDDKMAYVISCHDHEGVNEVLEHYGISKQRIFDGRNRTGSYVESMLAKIDRDE